MSTGKGVMHFEGRKSIGAMEAAENQRRWDADHYKTVNKKPLHWYDITRAHLNFEVARGGKIQKIGTSMPVEERYKQRLAELGVKPNQEVKKNSPEANKLANQIVEFVFSGDHDTMNRMAFGEQKVDFARDGTADNSHVERDEIIEYWAKDLYKWLSKKYGEENIIGFDVHLDETTAHCHATIIPVVMRTDKKTGKERPVVSYKGLFGKDKATGQQIMKDLHTELYEQVNHGYGLRRGDPVERTDARHKDKVEMYYQMKRDISELEDKVIHKQIALEKLMFQYRGLENQIEDLKSELADKKITLEEYEARTAKLQSRQSSLADKIKERRKELMEYEGKISTLRQTESTLSTSVDRAKKRVLSMTDDQMRAPYLMAKGSIFDEFITQLSSFMKNSMPTPSEEALANAEGTLVGDFLDGSLGDVVTRAGGIVAAAITEATTPTQSYGGGGSSDSAPKKRDDEDWWKFASRMVGHASRNKPVKKAKSGIHR